MPPSEVKKINWPSEQQRHAASRGDAAALQILCQCVADSAELNDQSTEPNPDPDLDPQQQINAIIRALEQGLKNLEPGHFRLLVQGLAQARLNQNLADLLSTAVRKKKTGAMQSLRDALRKKGSLGENSANVLALLRSQLNDTDYRLIGEMGLRYVGQCPAKDLLRDSARDGKSVSLSVLRRTLLSDDEDYDGQQHFIKLQAAMLCIEIDGAITSEILPAIARLSRAGRVEERATLLQALAELASHDDPMEGAVHAFALGLDAIPPKSSFDDFDALREVERRYVRPAFRAAINRGDQQTMAALAPLVIKRARSQDLVVAAGEVIYGPALDGDARSLQALAETAGKSLSGGDGDANSLAVKILEASARGGQAEAVVTALLQELQRRGKNDDERALEAIGRAARFLPKGHALSKKARSALRRAVNTLHPLRTHGHASALRGLSALADRLRERDIKALLDHMGGLSAQILIKAAPTLTSKSLQKIYTELNARADKGVNAKGAEEVLDAIEPLLPDTLLYPELHESPTSQRKKKAKPSLGEELGGKSLAQLLNETDAMKGLSTDKDAAPDKTDDDDKKTGW